MKFSGFPITMVSSIFSIMSKLDDLVSTAIAETFYSVKFGSYLFTSESLSGAPSVDSWFADVVEGCDLLLDVLYSFHVYLLLS